MSTFTWEGSKTPLHPLPIGTREHIAGVEGINGPELDTLRVDIPDGQGRNGRVRADRRRERSESEGKISNKSGSRKHFIL